MINPNNEHGHRSRQLNRSPGGGSSKTKAKKSKQNIKKNKRDTGFSTPAKASPRNSKKSTVKKGQKSAQNKPKNTSRSQNINQQYHSPNADMRYTNQQHYQHNMNSQSYPYNAGSRPKKTAPPVNSNDAKRRKRRLTPEQAAARRKKQLAEKRRAQIRRAMLLRLILSRIILFFVVFVFLLIVSVAAFFVNLFNNSGGINKNDYIYQIDTGSNNEQISIAVPWNSAKIDGEFYIDFTRLADLYGFTVTGDVNELRFIVKSGGGESVTFELNGSYTEINGMKTRLPSKVYQTENRVYVPLTFVERYVKGLSAAYYNESRKVVVSRELITGDAAGGASKAISYKPIYFTVRPPERCERVPEYIAIEIEMAAAELAAAATEQTIS